MAEIVLGYVLENLATFLANELKHLGGVGEKVQRVQRELIRIQCYLKDADTKHKVDARVLNWLNELCDVAYRIEDATDTFLLEVEDHRQYDLSFLQNLEKMCKKPYVLHKLGNELKNILNELEGISKSRVDYGIVALQDMIVEEAPVIMPMRRATYHEVDETEVVGMKADKNNILKLLRREETPRRTVITIMGAGGLGKTTLAHMVYKSSRAEFSYHIMLSISQQFSLIDLVKKMLQQFEDSIPVNQDLGDLMGKLKSFLSSRRYLIILDDVWTDDLWNQLKHALPDVKNGSRILMTSRSIEVAQSADPETPPYEIYILDAKKSLDLLLKNALSYKKPNQECSSDLLDLATELSKKCNGLPLALIVLGGILSAKERDYFAWERVLRTMDWQSDCQGCMEVLALSYQDMPYYLKACFLYLASFSEDYEIPAKDLIRMWIAEGLIACKGKTTKEEMAEKYLDQLFQRSMIQVSSRSIYGLIKSFNVHDLLRDLAMHEAMHQNFVTVFSEASQDNLPNRKIRRSSFQAQQKNLQFVKYLGPNTRSLLFFGLGLYTEIQIPKFSNFKLLKVLELVNVRNKDCGQVQKLIHLRYLGFRNCLLSNLSSISFRRMKTLETLDLRGIKIVQSNFSWAAGGTLRHVLCHRMYPINGPHPTVDQINLQTMKWIRLPRSWATKLPLLTNLRKLGVKLWRIEDRVVMTNLLATLPSLVSLWIIDKDSGELPMEIVYPKGLPNYQNLQSLNLSGMWPATTTLDASLFPPRLIKLKLSKCNFEQNPMSELGKLKNLKKLSLLHGVIKSSVPTICSEGFPILQCLEVRDLNFKDLVVAKGVMPMLTYLHVHKLVRLQLPPELQHVTVKQGSPSYF